MASVGEAKALLSSAAPSRLEHAYRRDLPIGLVRYAEPQLLGRVPLRYSDVLPFLHAQERTRRLQRQQVRRDPYHNSRCEQQQHRDGRIVSGRERKDDLDDLNDGTEEGEEEGDCTLPDGIWNALCEAVAAAAAQSVPVLADNKAVSDYATGVSPAEESEAEIETRDGRGRHAAVVSSLLRLRRGSAPPDDPLPRLARNREAVLTYLFSSPQRAQPLPLTNAATATTTATTPPPPPAANDCAKMEASDTGKRWTVCVSEEDEDSGAVSAHREEFLYGIRAIPAASHEFLETLAGWTEKLRAQSLIEESQHEGTDAQQLVATGVGRDQPLAAQQQQPLPLTLKQTQTIYGLLSSGRVAPSSTIPAGAPTPDLSAASGACIKNRLLAYASHPIVKSDSTDVLDALVPPRLLLYYSVDSRTARRFLVRRREQLRALRRLESEIAQLAAGSGAGARPSIKNRGTANNGEGSGKASGGAGDANAGAGRIMALERQRQAVYDALRGFTTAHGGVPDRTHTQPSRSAAAATASTTDPVDLADPVLGEAVLMMECPSRRQATRTDLLELEAQLDTMLHLSRARGCGAPPRAGRYAEVKSRSAAAQAITAAATGTMMRTMRGTSDTALKTMANVSRNGKAERVGGTGRVPALPTQPRTGDASTVSAAGMRAANLTAAAHRGNGMAATMHVAGGAKVNASITQGDGIGGQPLAEVHGSTASVATALSRHGHLELSHERTTLQFHLLRDELLRQVTLDLPERGVLLSRLLHEASLSMEAYDTLVRAAIDGAHQHRCLDGAADTTAAACSRVRILEAELDGLRARRVEKQEQQRALKAWVKERRAADALAQGQRRAFEEAATARLRQQAEMVEARQDRERRPSAAAV